MKNDIILVFYVKVNFEDNFNEEIYHVREQVDTYMKKKNVHYFIVPIENGDNRIECINPVLINEEQYKKARKLLEEQNALLNNHAKNCWGQ